MLSKVKLEDLHVDSTHWVLCNRKLLCGQEFKADHEPILGLLCPTCNKQSLHKNGLPHLQADAL